MKKLSSKQTAWWVLIGTAGIELATVVLRFGFQLESTRDTASTIGRLTFGLRIHHGYIGVLLFAIAMIPLRSHRALAQRVLIVGLSLVFSDLLHHFVVLWLAVGSPEFHLVYPS